MALTLNNFVGFETGGLEEAVATGGTPDVQEVTVRTGDYSLYLGAAETYDIRIIGSGADGGSKYVIGFAVRFPDATPVSSSYLFYAYDSAGICFRLRLLNTGVLQAIDATGAEIGTAADAFEDDVWAFVEIAWDHSDSGGFDLHINGVSKIAATEKDLSAGGSIDDNAAVYRLLGGPATPYLDDIYCYSGATDTDDFLGDAEVFRYQADTASATPDTGDDIDYGSSTLYWQEVGTTPGDADEIGYAAYPTTGAVYTDDVESGKHYRHGPHGDANIDGTIIGGKWLHQLKGGGAGDYYKRYGNDGDGLTDAVATLTTAYVSYMTVSELATEVPLVTEHFAIGFKNLDERKDLFCKGMWAFILHVPSTGPAEYQKSFGETASMSAAFAKGLTLAATVFAETHSHSESVVKTMFNPFGETTGLAESLTRLSGKAFSETAALAEGIARKVGLGISETASTAEALVKMVPRVFTETADMAELLARLRTKIFSEAVDMGEAVVRGVRHAIAETTSLAESLDPAITFRRVLAETADIAESLVRLPGKVFSETTNMSEGIVRKVGHFIAETASLSAALLRGVKLSVGETVSHSEAFAKGLFATFTETGSLSETLARLRTKAFSEAASLVESVVRKVGHPIAETASLAESFDPAATFRRVFAEAKSLVENFSLGLVLSQTFAETMALAESLARVPGKAFAEAASLAEILVRKVGRGIAETANMTEALVRGRFKSFAETLSGLVEALGTEFIPGGGPPAVLRKLAYYAISLLPSRTRRRGRK